MGFFNLNNVVRFVVKMDFFFIVNLLVCIELIEVCLGLVH